MSFLTPWISLNQYQIKIDILLDFVNIFEVAQLDDSSSDEDSSERVSRLQPRHDLAEGVLVDVTWLL